jgi:DNA-binding CsgD family transcriptional regulator
MLRHDFAAAIFNRLAVALIIVEQAGTVVPANEEAVRAWAASDLETIFYRVLDVLLPRSGWTPVVARLRALTGATPDTQADVPFQDRTVRVNLVVFPEPARLGGRPPAVAAVLIFDPARMNEARAETASRVYGLTPAETTVARLLLEGLSPAGIATHLHVAQATIRTHLSQLFAKTETRRQAELLRLLLLVPPARS